MVDGQKEPYDVEEGDAMEEWNVIEKKIKKEKQNLTLERRWIRAQMKTMVRIEKSSILKMTAMMADGQVTKCSVQLGSTECGYCMIRFMKEIMEEGIEVSVKDNFRDGKVEYTTDDINEIREEWSEFVTGFIS
ncbi:unnamed protein product [Lactuca saligna]|uniref:Uncharacterized protein n=1 Tax=Lactuca saligna TaxID=75948 RepID=A0AA36DZ07_LACSI|nr:unnamed protein product [Lactuca saligna]